MLHSSESISLSSMISLQQSSTNLVQGFHLHSKNQSGCRTSFKRKTFSERLARGNRFNQSGISYPATLSDHGKVVRLRRDQEIDPISIPARRQSSNAAASFPPQNKKQIICTRPVSAKVQFWDIAYYGCWGTSWLLTIFFATGRFLFDSTDDRTIRQLSSNRLPDFDIVDRTHELSVLIKRA